MSEVQMVCSRCSCPASSVCIMACLLLLAPLILWLGRLAAIWDSMKTHQGANSTAAGRWQEGDESCQGSANGPRRLPVFWVVRGDRQADLHASLKSAVGGEEHERGGLEGIVGWQEDPAVIDPALQAVLYESADSLQRKHKLDKRGSATNLELAVRRASNSKVPLKDVVLHHQLVKTSHCMYCTHERR